MNGPLFKTILDDMDAVIANPTSSLKFHIFQAHDANIA